MIRNLEKGLVIRMIGTVLVISLILTVFVLVLSLVTISKGYGYKHTIDPLEKKDENEHNEKQESTVK